MSRPTDAAAFSSFFHWSLGTRLFLNAFVLNISYLLERKIRMGYVQCWPLFLWYQFNTKGQGRVSHHYLDVGVLSQPFGVFFLAKGLNLIPQVHVGLNKEIKGPYSTLCSIVLSCTSLCLSAMSKTCICVCRYIYDWDILKSLKRMEMDSAGLVKEARDHHEGVKRMRRTVLM